MGSDSLAARRGSSGWRRVGRMGKQRLGVSSDESATSNRSALHRAKVRSLAAFFWADGGTSAFEDADFPSGGAVTAPGDVGRWAWIYPATPPTSLGGALVWADRHDVTSLFVLVDAGPDAAASRLARQAGYVAQPDVEVLESEGDTLVPADPAPFPQGRDVDLSGPLVDALRDAGTEVVAEGGVVRGEVDGLEVARIVEGQTTAGVLIDQPMLEVGVGAADRELTEMLHGNLNPEAKLQRVVEFVRQHRSPAAPHHPLNQLVPERWLRAVLCRVPEAIGLKNLEPAEAPTPRTNLKVTAIAVAQGETLEGTPIVVACSVGIDVNLVSNAADARAFINPEAELWLVVPDRDAHPTTERLATHLHHPAKVVPVPDNWRAL